MRLIILIISLVCFSSSWASESLDNELRCCLTNSDRTNVFVINLATPGMTKAELKMTDPKGVISGYMPEKNRFLKPTTSLIYASFLSAPTPFEHHHDQGRNKGFVIKKLFPGNYKLDVIGIRDGSYSLSFHPAGYGNSRGSVFVGKGYININKGEVHTYQFPGTFDNVLDGGIPMSSPTRFKVKRLN